MKKKVSLTIMLFMFFSVIGKTQGIAGMPSLSTDNIIPKSPQAAELLKVSKPSVNAAKGIPDISFDLYKINIGNLSIPISIRYDATGIKFDDIPGTVGLKWNLLAGGEISRNINGRPDESGYFQNAYKYTSQAYFSAMDLGTQSVQSFFKSIAENHIDITHDNFSYTTPFQSGSFIFKNNKLWDTRNPHTVKVETDNIEQLNYFTITDESGNKFLYSKENSEVTMAGYTGNGYVIPDVPSEGITAWKIKKITLYNGLEAQFEYDTYNYSVNKLVQQTWSHRIMDYNPPALEFGDPYLCNCGQPTMNNAYSNMNYYINNIKKISTPTEEINFYYSIDNTLSLFKKKLDSITIKSVLNNNHVKTINLFYGKYVDVNYLRLDSIKQTNANNNELIAAFKYKPGTRPNINSLSRDIFGYFNGAANTTLIAASDPDFPYMSANRGINENLLNGILNTVQYPTGGSTVYSYGINKINTYDYMPGARVDSIKTINADGSIAQQIQYAYKQGLGFFTYQVYNALSADGGNPNCPVKNFGSEEKINNDPSNAFYTLIETRSIGNNEIQLSQESYKIGSDGYINTIPLLTQRAFFQNNSLTDTVKVERIVYEDKKLDSLSVFWGRPGNYYLPGFYYILDNQLVYGGDCQVFYDGAASKGFLNPRVQLPKEQEVILYTGADKITEYVKTNYNSFWQTSSQIIKNSKGEFDSTAMRYLYQKNDALSSIVNNDNLYGAVTSVIKYKGSNIMSGDSVVFKKSEINKILPDTLYNILSGNALKRDINIISYDNANNPIEVSNNAGIIHSFIRDWKNEYVIASAVNANYADIAATSFEADGKGNFSFTGAPIADATAPTGKKVYSLSNGSITKSGLSAAKTYIVSYWSKNGNQNVNVANAKIAFTKNGWTCYVHEVVNPVGGIITISGAGVIDELRVYPKESQMTTYTYDPLIGITSECDANNNILYYEYDSLNRLKLIKDDKKSVIKTLDYKYSTTNN